MRYQVTLSIMLTLVVVTLATGIVPHPGCPLQSNCTNTALRDSNCPNGWQKTGEDGKNPQCITELGQVTDALIAKCRGDLQADLESLVSQYQYCGVADGIVFRGVQFCECAAGDVETLSVDFLRESYENGLLHYGSVYPGKQRSRRAAATVYCSGTEQCKLAFDQRLDAQASDDGLSTGAIVGIAVAAAAVIIAVVATRLRSVGTPLL